jgi:hypothetical protein
MLPISDEGQTIFRLAPRAGREREPPLPDPLLHKHVEEREIRELLK